MSNILWDALTHSEDGEGRGSRFWATIGSFGIAAACLAVGWWLLSGAEAGYQDMQDLNLPGRTGRRVGRTSGMLGVLGIASVAAGGLFALLGAVLGVSMVLPKRTP